MGLDRESIVMAVSRRNGFSAVVVLYLFTATVAGRAVNISNTWMLPEEGFPVFYRYFRDRISWTEADAVCQFHHANLVTVDTTSQYDAVRAYLKELDIASNVWIGLSRSADKPNFTWRDFRTLSLTDYWQEAIPTGSDPLCAAMDPAADFRWHALSCGGLDVAPFICELPVPSWANGPRGCLLTELPSLTVLYIPEQSAVELTSDCGLGGTKQISCKGNTDRDDMLRRLACTDTSSDLLDDKATSTVIVNHESSTLANTNSANTKTTKPWIWTSNTIDTGDYGLPTRHRRETDDTLSPSATKSTTELSLQSSATTPLTPLTITPTPLLDELTTAQDTDVSTEETITASDSVKTSESPAPGGEEFSSAINQGQLFSIIENGTMFDIIELNNTTNNQEEKGEITQPNVGVTSETPVPIVDKKKKKTKKTSTQKELSKEVPTYPIIGESSSVMKLNRTFRKQVPDRKADIMDNSIKEIVKHSLHKSVEIRIQNPETSKTAFYVTTRMNADKMTSPTTTVKPSSPLTISTTERADLKDPDIIKSTASSQVQRSTRPIKNVEGISSTNVPPPPPPSPPPPKSETEFDSEPTSKPNRQRQLTRPQRRSFYPYFFSRVLG